MIIILSSIVYLACGVGSAWFARKYIGGGRIPATIAFCYLVVWPALLPVSLIVTFLDWEI